MRKKLLAVAMVFTMVFALASCDFLSTIQAAAGFATDYNEYKGIYENATQFTVLTETDLTISESTVVDELIEDMHTSLYLEIDKDSNFLYVEHEGALDVDGISVYEDAEDVYVDYQITLSGEDTIITPTEPAEDAERIDGEFNFNNILNEEFNPETVDNLLLVDDVYSFDVGLTEAVNVDELDEFVNQYDIFAGELTAFDDAIAHVEMEFISTDNTIDVSVSVADYRIDFEDETYVILSFDFHALVSVPTDFTMFDVFSDDYQFVAVDSLLLARKVYGVDQTINYPAVTGESGYAKFELTAGIYELNSENMENFTYVLSDSSMTALTVTEGLFEVTADGVFYLYITPTADFQTDISVSVFGSTVVTTTEVPTTEVPTTEVPTTQAPA